MDSTLDGSQEGTPGAADEVFIVSDIRRDLKKSWYVGVDKRRIDGSREQ